MKKSLHLGASMLAVVAAGIVPASAADMYRAEPGSYKDAPVYAAANTWTGFYAGAHFGGASGNEVVTDKGPQHFNLGNLFPFSNVVDSRGFGGLQAGYNWQHGNIVFGVEVDLGAMDLGHNVSAPYDNRVVDHREGGLYGDATGRLGYSFGSALAYAKGGFAFFDGRATIQYPQDTTSKSNDTYTGWTVGGGLEYALSPAWSAKAEYQHFDFGNDPSLLLCSICRPQKFTFDHELTLDTVKVGLNYHVGGPGYEPLK